MAATRAQRNVRRLRTNLGSEGKKKLKQVMEWTGGAQGKRTSIVMGVVDSII